MRETAARTILDIRSEVGGRPDLIAQRCGMLPIS